MAKARAAAKPRHVERDDYAERAHEDQREELRQRDAPAGPSAREFAELRQQLVALTGQYNELKQATGGVTLLSPEEVPIYEIGEGGYYSPDDVLYPAGVQIEDITGSIIPNEQMIPLNAPAERRMAAYLAHLDKLAPGATNNSEMFLEAAMMVAHTFDARGRNPVEAKLEFNKLVLDEMGRLQMKQRGMLPDNTPRLPVMPQRQGPVPMMSNTRIRNADGNGLFPDRVGMPAPQRGPLHTRVRAAAVDPANKAAPPMGTIQNQTLGR